MAQIENPIAGQTTFELRWFEGLGDHQCKTEEYGDEAEAMAVVKQVLTQGLPMKAFGEQSVSVIKWGHHWNLPRCLPEVVARSISLTVYEMGSDGEVVAKPVSIHG